MHIKIFPTNASGISVCSWRCQPPIRLPDFLHAFNLISFFHTFAMNRILLLLLLLPSLLFAQKPPALEGQVVAWEVWAVKADSDSYTLHVNGKIAKGWHVYAQADTALGLEPVSISWDNEDLVKVDRLQKSGGELVVYKDPVFDHKEVKVCTNEINLEWGIKANGFVPSALPITINGFASNDTEFRSLEDVKEIALPGAVATSKDKIKRPSILLTNPVNTCGDDLSNHTGLLAVFLLGFLGGLLALLTPCVFPMLPVTVSFFMGKSKSRAEAIKNGLWYGTFIFLIYVIASSPFHLIKGIDKNIFNSIATNAWVNVAFFIVFIVFALSFFGLFEITLPGGAANKAGSKSDLSSVPGIFFMALTLAIVSFSCTGVILGVLLANVAAAGPWALTAGMAGFGLALALPFALSAIFPNLLKSIPKSGSWLGTVKKVLAFVELALAFKFLSNADLVEHWGILKREVFIGIWLLITIALALYLLGVFEKRKVVMVAVQRSYHVKRQGPKISNARKGLGILALCFAGYMLPGLTPTKYASLQMLSGFPPPLSYSLYGDQNAKEVSPRVINDYEKALQLARSEHKPLLIDFTGWACVNCRKMEENVWTKPGIRQTINDQFILVSLYVDDRKKLPGSQQFRYKSNAGEEKQIRTVGDQWATFQAENFSQVTQPLYVILSPDEKLLNHPVGYTPDENNYKRWLECGLNAYQKKKTL